jgi:hypothetical protein
MSCDGGGTDLDLRSGMLLPTARPDFLALVCFGFFFGGNSFKSR